jgi:hypothetical protein
MKAKCSTGHFVNVYSFAIDSESIARYYLAAPQGVQWEQIFENLAVSKWQLAIGLSNVSFATCCRSNLSFDVRVPQKTKKIAQLCGPSA